MTGRRDLAACSAVNLHARAPTLLQVEVEVLKPRMAAQAPRAAPSAGSSHQLFLDGILAAQEAQRSGYSTALREVTAGRKRSHWIWYVWPSHEVVRKTSRREYLLPHASAAAAWLKHPVLGPRFMQITGAACKHLERGVAARELFGSSVDVDKFHECVTTFAVAAEQHRPVLVEAAALCHRALTLLGRPAHARAQEVAAHEMAHASEAGPPERQASSSCPPAPGSQGKPGGKQARTITFM